MRRTHQIHYGGKTIRSDSVLTKYDKTDTVEESVRESKPSISKIAISSVFKSFYNEKAEKVKVVTPSAHELLPTLP
jgi:hypothetical protein